MEIKCKYNFLERQKHVLKTKSTSISTVLIAVLKGQTNYKK